jgi:hypothetical protein
MEGAKVRGLAVVALTLLLAAAAGCGKGEQAAARGAAARLAAVHANADDLPGTVVTAVLDCPIEKGKNVLWCCTFQLAWDEYRARFGTDLPDAGGVPLVAALNSSKVTDADIEKGSYVAVAGQTGADLTDRLRAAMVEAFGGGAGQRLVSYLSEQPAGQPAAYAALGKQLAFEYAFTRFTTPFTFGGRQVESFGIDQYLEDQEDEARMAGQVLVHDLANREDFVIELKTTTATDRLLLARVPPAETLAATIAAVRERATGRDAAKMDEGLDLRIPVIDFDLIRDYPGLLDLGFLIARQRTRFRLDEAGAVLKSEALNAFFATPEQPVFSGPFLVLLERKGAANPYFALWVANAELLTPWHGD